MVLAATVQEEVGLRGGPAAYACEPDVAVAIDTTLCVDTPGVPEDERVTKQGTASRATIMDSASIGTRLIDEFEAVARKREIESAQHPPPRRHRRRADAAGAAACGR